jgi:hypothetical protein
MVCVDNGALMSFWLVSWLPLGTLHQVHTELFSHSLDSEATVASVIDDGLDCQFVLP